MCYGTKICITCNALGFDLVLSAKQKKKKHLPKTNECSSDSHLQEKMHGEEECLWVIVSYYNCNLSGCQRYNM